MNIVARMISLVVLSLTGCTSVEPTFVSYKHHPLLDTKTGIVIVADGCVRRSELFNNYVVVEESKVMADALLKSIDSYLKANKVKVKGMVVPAVCGFLSVDKSVLQDVAEKSGGEIAEKPGPYGVSEEYVSETDLIDALSKVSLNAYSKPWADKKNSKSKTSSDESNPVKLPISDSVFFQASSTIARKLHTPVILYVSAAGITGSGGIKTVNFLGNVITGTVTAMTVGPTLTVQDTSYYVVAAPFPTSTDSMHISISLVDLENGEIPWSKGMIRRVDPTELDKVKDMITLDYLLAELVRQDSSEWTPPGKSN